MVQKQVGWTRLALIFVALAAVAAAFAPSTLGGDHRLVVQLKETFVADGRVFQGGALSVREVGPYGPGVTLNDVRINGERIGLMLAGETAGEPAGTAHSVLFDRDSRGQLKLVGFSFRGERPRRLYRLHATPDDNRRAARATRALAEPESLVAAQ